MVAATALASAACGGSHTETAPPGGTAAAATPSATAAPAPAGGGSVAGSTYVGNGSVISVEFVSGGKAFVSMGPMTQTCTYTQAAEIVSLDCEGAKTELTVDEAGLTGPPNGMMTRLTKKK
jgi:hypothetical protein